jgi:hypothetical protein
MSAPVRGQRRVGTPSLVLPGDPDGCGYRHASKGVYVPSDGYAPDFRLRPRALDVRYVGRPSYWGNPWQATNENGFWQHHVAGEPKPRTFRYQDETAALKWAAIQHESWITGLGPIDQAQYVAPLVTADVLSCWCPLEDADGNTHPCHADTLCDLVGRLRSGDLVPGLVATPDVCGGALRIDGTEWAVAEIASNVDSWADAGMCRNDMVLQTAGTYSLDPELVRLAARVGGAL